MKQQIVRLFDYEEKCKALALLEATDATGKFEMVIRDATISKTLQQLGGLFGVWIKELSQELAESEDYLHRMLKAKFLARIYVTMPIGEEQEQWVELLYQYQVQQKQVALKKHAKRISLKWATIKQMKDYMEAVKNHYATEGIILPVLDRHRP